MTAWFVMLLVSIANGVIRDFTYGKYLRELTAHQLSTVSGILLLGAVMWGLSILALPVSGSEAVSIGLFWAMLTIAFEFLIFHYVSGHSW